MTGHSSPACRAEAHHHCTGALDPTKAKPKACWCPCHSKIPF